MDFVNIKKIRPDVYEKINNSNKWKLVEYFKSLSILTDLSDKSYNNKEISSPYISLITNTYVLEYFVNKYNIDRKEILIFLLKVNKLVWMLDDEHIDLIIEKIDKISTEFFSWLIPIENLCDKVFLESLDIKTREWITDYELISTLFSEITYDVMEQNVIRKWLVLEICIDWIDNWQSLDEIIFSHCNKII